MTRSKQSNEDFIKTTVTRHDEKIDKLQDQVKDLEVRLGVIESKQTPKKTIIIIAVTIILLLLIPYTCSMYVIKSLPDVVVSSVTGGSVQEKPRDPSKPDANAIFNRIFDMMEKAMEREQKSHEFQQEDSGSSL